MAEERHHVLAFPLPLQGPVNSMLKLVELLCLADLRITLLLTDDIHRRLSRNSNIQARFGSYPGFRIRVISDGLPESHPRGDNFLELIDSLRMNAKPLLNEIILSETSPVSCIVADGILGFSGDVALELGVPFFYLRSISAACLWIFCRLPELIQAREIPFQDDDLDTGIKSVPGMESFLRRRDLPSFCRSKEADEPCIQLYKTEAKELPRAKGIILNTFMELEDPILHQFRTLCPNIYTIGPLHAHLKSKLAEKSTAPPPFSNSLWKEDRVCLQWLDSQPPKSVIYVSFGSLAVITTFQLMEFYHGLVNSGHRFLWVIRPHSQAGNEPKSTAELLSGLKDDRGYIVEWAPQEEVLAHRAVGGFLTHGGWNSTLESVYEGVPMVCWPYFVDQQVNSRMVEEWKLGLDLKDTCDRRIIEEAVRDVMEKRKLEFRTRATEMADAARRCLGKSGSSSLSLDRLIRDIKSLGESKTLV